MLSTIAAIALAALLPTAFAGNAIIINKCPTPAYLWSVGGSVGSKVVLATNGSYSETYHVDPTTGGIAIKITTVDDGLYKSGVPQTIFSYSLDGATVWYDLSDVFGDAFSGEALTIRASDTSCPAVIWPTGVSPAGSQTKACASSSDVTFTLCA